MSSPQSIGNRQADHQSEPRRPTGSYVFYLWSDDSSRLWLNPTGIVPAGKVLIAEETACCGPWTKIVSPPQALVAGNHYYIEAVYKEGGGGDYIFVGATLEGAPAPANPTFDAIQATSLGVYADPAGASITITKQPEDVLFTITAGAGVPQPLLTQGFNSGDGGFTATKTGVATDWAGGARSGGKAATAAGRRVAR